MGNKNVCSNRTFTNTGDISLSDSTGTCDTTTVANASGKTLRTFYRKEKIKLEDVLLDSTKKLFKPKAETKFIELKPNQHFEVPSLKDGYVSIFVVAEEVCVETVSLNFQLASGAGCIVTDEKEIKLRKSDGGIWVDKDGHNHRTN